MGKSLKSVILITILVVPALVYVFLKNFGSNRFDLPYYFPVLDESGEVKIINGDTTFSKAPEFKLLKENSDTLAYSPGKVTIVYFFFSRCGTICPITNTNMVKVADVFKTNKEVNFYGITVDPKFDTPEVLKTYGRALGVDRLNFNLLTGDKKYIYDLSIKDFRLPVADASEYDKNISNIDEMFIHSDKVMLIDREGFFRGIYTGTSKEEMDRLKLEIKVLLSHESKR
jgi:protein SCO1/2